MHFPTGASNRWGRGEQSRGTATVASCHSGLGRSFFTQLLMPRCPPAIYHSSLIDMHCPQIPPPCFAPSIPHFPLWISAAGSCQDCTDVHKHLPTMYVHVFTKLLLSPHVAHRVFLYDHIRLKNLYIQCWLVVALQILTTCSAMGCVLKSTFLLFVHLWRQIRIQVPTWMEEANRHLMELMRPEKKESIRKKGTAEEN